MTQDNTQPGKEVMDKVQLKYRQVVFVTLALFVGSAVIDYYIIVNHIAISIGTEIFHAFLEVIAILLGFSTVGLFFYYDKLHQIELEIQNAYYLGKGRIERIQVDEAGKPIKAEQLATLEKAYGTINGFTCYVGDSIIHWIVLFLVVYGIGIGLAIIGMALPSLTTDYGKQVPTTLVSASVAIVSGMMGFLGFMQIYRLYFDYFLKLLGALREVAL